MWMTWGKDLGNEVERVELGSLSTMMTSNVGGVGHWKMEDRQRRT